MSLTTVLARLFKWLFISSATITVLLHSQKDEWPTPDYYALDQLQAPLQTETERVPFSIEANALRYTINPQFDYLLDGVVVSFSNADGFTNIWHHKRWKDFVNVRDLCVIWGENVESGVYRDMKFSSDSWTCWAYWPDQQTGATFKMNALSNNHLVTNNDAIKAKLLQAEAGDHIRLKGVLASYVNHSGGYTRGTSTTRDDTGQGACETIYVDHFEIVKKSNLKLRKAAGFFDVLTMVSLIGFIGFFLAAPFGSRYR